MKRLVPVLVTLTAALALTPAVPAAADVLGISPASLWSVRAGAYPAAEPTGAGTVKLGRPETITVSVYDTPASQKPLRFKDIYSDLGSRFRFKMLYGWNACGYVGQMSLPLAERTATCSVQQSPIFPASSQATTWTVTTNLPAL